jgi:hypothetical protein
MTPDDIISDLGHADLVLTRKLISEKSKVRKAREISERFWNISL